MTSTSPRTPPSLRRGLRQAHRILGLLVGLQLLLWVSGGAVMSLLKIEEVRGETRRAHAAPALLPDPSGLLAPAELFARTGRPAATQLMLTTLLQQPVYRVEGPDGTWLADAVSGEKLSPLNADWARRLALADYAGAGVLVAVDWITTPDTEYRGRSLPLWRVRFEDDRQTTLYVSADTGQVVARRNQLWRVFDFFWMLHIMDYDEREDFNHPLLVAFALSALLFVFSGLGLLLAHYGRRQKK